MGVLYSMADLDKEFLEEYLEEKFAQRLITQIETLNEKGYKVLMI